MFREGLSGVPPGDKNEALVQERSAVEIPTLDFSELSIWSEHDPAPAQLWSDLRQVEIPDDLSAMTVVQYEVYSKEILKVLHAFVEKHPDMLHAYVDSVEAILNFFNTVLKNQSPDKKLGDVMKNKAKLKRLAAVPQSYGKVVLTE